MVFIRVLYKGKSDNEKTYKTILGCVKISDINRFEFQETPTLYFENSEQFILNWNKAVKIANGDKLEWFINVSGTERTFCFSGVPMPISENDLVVNEQGVTIAEISDCRWEQLAIKSDEILKTK